MGIDPQQLRKYVIEPTLESLSGWNARINSEAAVRLLLMTAAHESKMGHYLHQVRGPAVGIWQMEPATMVDLHAWIMTRHGLDTLVERLRTRGFPLSMQDEMAGNLFYACAMARLLYWRRPEELPDAEDWSGLAQYAKDHFNTRLGKATPDDYERAAREFEIA